MILWMVRQLLSLRQAVMGRSRPSELAWGLALGVVIGLIPKGNLLSLVVLGSLVSFRINHGMAALVAVAVSFLAVYLDPWTHELGAAVLASERIRPLMQRIWNWPLMPWTDLNNTVVMGSTLLAAAALLPAFALSLPLFRMFAQQDDAGPGAPDDPPSEAAEAVAIEEPQNVIAEAAGGEPIERPLAETGGPETIEPEPVVHVETQIDVIRLKPDSASDEPAVDPSETVSGGQMNEALGYLLRRLRDSRQEKAA